jgi:hypothetical protein
MSHSCVYQTFYPRVVATAPRKLSPFLLAGSASVVTAGLGIAITFAANWKTNALAWILVAILMVVAGVLTGLATSPSNSIRGASTTAVVSTKGRFRRSRQSKYDAVGLHLELIEESENGRRIFTRAYTEEAARMVIEMRRPGTEPGDKV